MTKKKIPFILLVLLLMTGGRRLAAETADSLPHFEDVTAQAGITAVHRGVWAGKGFQEGEGGEAWESYLGAGQAWGDFDRDGWLDLYVTGGLAENVLYRNQRDGTFAVTPHQASVALPAAISGGAVWADYDNDGWLDLYVLTKGVNVLFHNEQGRGFVDTTQTARVGDSGAGQSATWGDYDRDGDLDLYVVNWSCVPDCDPVDFTTHQDVLYRNNGDGTFTNVSELLAYPKLLGAGFAASFVDYDGDGDLDIYIINDEFQNPIGNVLFQNEGPGCGGWCWRDVSAESRTDVVLSGMGIAIGDYDNDADLDFYFSNMLNEFSLLDNRADGTFDDRAEAAGVHFGWTDTVGWGTGFFDYNNDGWLDLYLATTGFIQRDLGQDPEGMHFPKHNYLFHNNQDGTFTDVWTGFEEPSKGFAYADYDNDGWVDFIVSNWNEGFRLYRNTGGDSRANNWLTVDLAGSGPVNQGAIGARVYLSTAGGQRLMQEVNCGSSLGAGNDTRLHFGLGQAESADVEVVWPNGERTVFEQVKANQIWQVTYGQNPGQPDGLPLALIIIYPLAGFLLLFFWLRRSSKTPGQ